MSLREDRRIARSEAAERAQFLADDLAQRFWSALTKENASSQAPRYPAFCVDPSGQLLHPLPIPPWPAPAPLTSAELSPAQAQLWRQAEIADAEQKDQSAGLKVLRSFLELDPPRRFAAAAHYSLGLLLASAGETEAAMQAFRALLDKYPEAIGESGFPLQPFARVKLLQLEENLKLDERETLESFCSNIVYFPNSLTSEMLEEILNSTEAPLQHVVQRWQRVWEDQERARRLYAAASQQFDSRALLFSRNTQKEPHILLPSARQQLQSESQTSASPAPAMFWFTTHAAAASAENDQTSASGAKDGANPIPAQEFGLFSTKLIVAGASVGKARAPEPLEQKWLAVRSLQTPTNSWFICRKDYEARDELSSLAANIPEYFGIAFELAGKTFVRAPHELELWTEHHYGGKGGGWDRAYSGKEVSAAELLASAAYPRAETEWLKVNVYLTSSATLFSRQRARTFWFGSLIGVSAVAALIGLATGWRAFHRQLQLNELKSNFVSSVSHELRAPVASVRLMVENLQNGKISEPGRQEEYFRFISQECGRLSSLVANVLDFSRIEQGRKEYEIEPTDLVALAKHTVKLMEPYAAERQIQLALAVPDAQASSFNFQVPLDGKAIQQALVNLIDNAIKHAPKGETVTVGLEERGNIQHPTSNIEAEPGPSVSLFVEDHGEGIPPEEHEKIFERFYRCGSELRRETQGVGIGLSIVKYIVEAHGGRVVVRSAVGKGSRFTIELPLGAPEQNPNSE